MSPSRYPGTGADDVDDLTCDASPAPPSARRDVTPGPPGGGFGGLVLAACSVTPAAGRRVGPRLRPVAAAAALPRRRPRRRHPAVHARRAQPRRPARSQADAGERYDGKPPPAEVADDEKLTGNLLKSPYRFRKHGQSGLEFSETLAAHRPPRRRHRRHPLDVHRAPQSRAGAVDDAHRPDRRRPAQHRRLGRLRPGHDQPEPARLRRPARPARPAGRRHPQLVERLDAAALPGHAVPLRGDAGAEPASRGRRGPPPWKQAGCSCWPTSTPSTTRRHPDELELDARIASFELAARMQLSATDALDIDQETPATQRLYGLDKPTTRPYGLRCLMARRLVERGVRFVQIFMAGQPWDTHSNNAAGTRNCCEQTDLPVAGLLTDLKQRGLLDDDAGLLGRRVRPHAGRAGQGRPRPSSLRLQRLAGRRRHQGRPGLRRHRRLRLPRRRRPLQRRRPARHDAAPARPRLQQAARIGTMAATSG